jgi:hypothetical protein
MGEMTGPSEDELLKIGRDAVAEEKRLHTEASTKDEADTAERNRLIAAYNQLIDRFEAITKRLDQQGVPIKIERFQRDRENHALLRLPRYRVLWFNLLRTPWKDLDVGHGKVKGAIYFGASSVGSNQVSDVDSIGANFLWIRPREGSEKWIACRAAVSGATTPQWVAEKYRLAVPTKTGRPFGIPEEDVLYERLAQGKAMQAFEFQFDDDLDGVARAVLSQALGS